MKNTDTALHTSSDLDTLQARFALRVAARLSEQAEKAPHDVSERLRFAREQALERARQVRRSAEASQTAPAIHFLGGGTAALSPRGGPASPWWLKLASVLPLLVLVAGLAMIQNVHNRDQIVAAAEIDAALLADNLPPDAYRDPGFVEYLKTAQE
jgi:hypothetical protein